MRGDQAAGRQGRRCAERGHAQRGEEGVTGHTVEAQLAARGEPAPTGVPNFTPVLDHRAGVASCPSTVGQSNHSVPVQTIWLRAESFKPSPHCV